MSYSISLNCLVHLEWSVCYVTGFTLVIYYLDDILYVGLADSRLCGFHLNTF